MDSINQQIPGTQPNFPEPKKSKKLIAIIAAAILVILAAGAGAAYYWYAPNYIQKACTMEAKICPNGSSVGRKGPNCEFAVCPSVSPSASVSTSPSPSVVAGETAGWQLYKNEKYGFEMEFPKKININGYQTATCVSNNLDSVVVINDNENNTVYIAGETAHSQTPGMSDSKCLTSTLDVIKSSDGLAPNSGPWYSAISMKIEISDAFSDNDIQKVIEENIGDRCRLGKKEATGQNGLFDISLVEEAVRGCYIAERYILKYMPEKNKLAFFILNGAQMVSSEKELEFDIRNVAGGYVSETERRMINSFKSK